MYYYDGVNKDRAGGVRPITDNRIGLVKLEVPLFCFCPPINLNSSYICICVSLCVGCVTGMCIIHIYMDVPT